MHSPAPLECWTVRAKESVTHCCPRGWSWNSQSQWGEDAELGALSSSAPSMCVTLSSRHPALLSLMLFSWKIEAVTPLCVVAEKMKQDEAG